MDFKTSESYQFERPRNEAPMPGMLGTLYEENIMLYAKITKLQEENSSLKMETRQLNMKSASFQTVKDDLADENKRLRKELEDLKNKQADKGYLSRSETIKTNYIEKIRDLEQELEMTSQKLHQVTLNNFALRTKLAVLAKRKEIPKRELESQFDHNLIDVRKEVQSRYDPRLLERSNPNKQMETAVSKNRYIELDQIIEQIKQRPKFNQVESSNGSSLFVMIVLSFLLGYILVHLYR